MLSAIRLISLAALLCTTALWPSAVDAAEDWTAELSVANAAGESVQLQFGQVAGATESVDSDLGERELPPLPPLTLIDIRFVLEGTNGATVDLRSPAINSQNWNLQIQAGSGGFPITLAWSPAALPPEASVLLIDAITGGDLIQVDMSRESTYVVENAGFTFLSILFEAPTAVLQDDASPSSFNLSANYPNPFNGSTVIPFSLASTTRVGLAIFSPTGQLLRRLWSGSLRAGQHQLAWDGRNDNGHAAASGTYLYVLSTPTGVLKRKLVLLR